MPNNENRPSLSKDLETRYSSQRVGGAFDVKKTLSALTPGSIINAISMQSNEFQSPNGFEIKIKQGDTQMKDARDGTKSKELSRYIKGISTKRYKS